MRILRDPTLSSYHSKVVGSLMYIFRVRICKGSCLNLCLFLGSFLAWVLPFQKVTVNSFMLTLEDYLDTMEVRCFKLNLCFLWFICENVGGVCSRWVLAAYLIYQRYAESLVRSHFVCCFLVCYPTTKRVTFAE
jgi:hypothetical protein